jgi:S1-C subfamily serine protease
MKSIPDAARFVVTYRKLKDINLLKRETLVNNRRWYKMKQAVRNRETGLWDSTNLDDPTEDLLPVCRKATFEPLKHLPSGLQTINQTVVDVSCCSPIFLNGESHTPPPSSGFVLDADRGFVIVSTVTVPNSLGDIFVTIANSVTVRGEYYWQHPWDGYTIIKYDPSHVNASIQAIALSSQKVISGASTYFVGMSSENKMRFASTTVNEVASLDLRTDFNHPKNRAMNSEIVRVETVLGRTCPSGILIGEDGTVQAIWLRYLTMDPSNKNKEEYVYLGLPTTGILPVIEELRKDKTPNLRVLGVEFQTITIQEARDLKVAETWIERVTESDGSHQFFTAKRTLSYDDESGSLREGDVILTLNDQIISSFSDLKVMYTNVTLQTRIVRSGEELIMQLSTTLADDFETKRALRFCGATLQSPHFGVRLQTRPPSEVYISHIQPGSPARHEGLKNGMYITSLNSLPISDLDSVLHAEKSIAADGCKSCFQNICSIQLVLIGYRFYPKFQEVRWR